MREHILDAAQEVFTTEGAHALSMRRLAEKIDYSPAAIYKYFGSKDDLIAEIREQFFTALSERLDAIAPGEEAFSLDKMRACIRAYIETGVAYPNHYRIGFLDGDAEEHEPDAPDTMSAQTAFRLQHMIAQGMASGALRKADPALVANSVWAAMHGLTHLRVEMRGFPCSMPGTEHLNDNEVLDAHVELILRGVMARPDEA